MTFLAMSVYLKSINGDYKKKQKKHIFSCGLDNSQTLQCLDCEWVISVQINVTQFMSPS